MIDLPYLDHIETESRDGQITITLSILDSPPNSEMPAIWQKVRNYCKDIEDDLPEGIVGPYYYDEYDEVYGSIYAVTGKDFS